MELRGCWQHEQRAWCGKCGFWIESEWNIPVPALLCKKCNTARVVVWRCEWLACDSTQALQKARLYDDKKDHPKNT